MYKNEKCCDSHNLITDNGKIVCNSCGPIHGYTVADEFVNFYEDMYRTREKSVYHRKYHIENILKRLSIEINYENRQRIYEIFELLDKASPEVNSDRKR